MPVPPYPGRAKQRGAALMVMLVILIMGALTLFVNSLSSNTTAIQIARDKTTAEALAQAKTALIGYAAGDANYPGELPCPDVDDDGKLTMNVDYSGSSCASPIGRLPWKTLGLPELRDGTGEHLWYAVAKNFWAMGTPSINSDTTGDLGITDATAGTPIANNVIAIVFAPGSALSGQSRSSTQAANCTTTGDTAAATYENLCATNYLEGTNPNATWNKFTASGTAINTGYQNGVSGISFNDQLIYITHDQLFATVEMRIAREVKACLDEYASSSSGKYPWAAPVSDTTYYIGSHGTLFGRFPIEPNRNTISSAYSAEATALSAALATLQTAVDNYYASPTSANKTTLIHKGNYVIGLQNSIPAISAATYTAGDDGKDYANGSQSYANALSSINAANNAVAPYLVISDTAMSSSWPTVCRALFDTSYWINWESLVFYQIADGYQPGSSASCGSCLSISGSGNPYSGSGSYRAAVIVAGQKLTGQSRSTPTAFPPDGYLSNTVTEIDPASITNSHASEINPSTTFITYKYTDATHQTVNDLVLCVDGKNYCK